VLKLRLKKKVGRREKGYMLNEKMGIETPIKKAPGKRNWFPRSVDQLNEIPLRSRERAGVPWKRMPAGLIIAPVRFVLPLKEFD